MIGSTHGGHYVASCKHPITKKWFEYNDNLWVVHHPSFQCQPLIISRFQCQRNARKFISVVECLYTVLRTSVKICAIDLYIAKFPRRFSSDLESQQNWINEQPTSSHLLTNYLRRKNFVQLLKSKNNFYGFSIRLSGFLILFIRFLINPKLLLMEHLIRS